MCGGTPNNPKSTVPSRGLSPRVRGNPSGLSRRTPPERSIPACAGEPTGPCHADRGCRVYPRVCGGTGCLRPPQQSDRGLSPRVRGNLKIGKRRTAYAGSIPACAGEPLTGQARTPQRRVYPRVCGGTTCNRNRRRPRQGLSPRVRGNLYYTRYVRGDKRSIPACAGEPAIPAAVTGSLRVYPRVCGGTAWRYSCTLAGDGLSPRVRGNRLACASTACTSRSIPACAGEPASRTYRVGRSEVYPRVCGGTQSAWDA